MSQRMAFRTFLVAATALLSPISAIDAAHTTPAAQKPVQQWKDPQGWDVVHGVLMRECEPKITACGKFADIKVEHVHGVTNYTTQYRTFEDVKTLPTETEVVTEVIIITSTTKTEGQCRKTTTVTDKEATLVVTVEVNTTTTREFIPVTTVTTVSTSVISKNFIDQCIVNGPGVTALPEPHLPPPIVPPGGPGNEVPIPGDEPPKGPVQTPSAGDGASTSTSAGTSTSTSTSTSANASSPSGSVHTPAAVSGKDKKKK